MEPKIIKRFPCGIVRLPSSKSLSHRALICAALAALGKNKGKSILKNIDSSIDIESTMKAIQALGADAVWHAQDIVVQKGGLNKSYLIDCAESGSTLRFLIPIAAALSEHQTCFTGRGRLLERPLDVYADLFKKANLPFQHEPHIVCVQGPLKAGTYEISADVSSQFITGLLLALSLNKETSCLHINTALESAPYVDLTLDVMKAFGVEVLKPSETVFEIPGGQDYKPTEYCVEADFSQAAFFLAAAALGRKVYSAGLNPDSRQGDKAILNVLEQMGAKIIWCDGLVTVEAQDPLQAATVDVRECPDLMPIISVLCCFCQGTSRIINAGRLRIKESDRLHSMAVELAKLGADLTEGDDYLEVRGGIPLKGAHLEAHNDHRVAMSLAVAALKTSGPMSLSGWESVSKSYPAFWHDFEKEEL